MGIGISILILGVLIFVHEMGHFLVAKFFRVGVLEFALGFGPRLMRWQTKETTYTLRAIPLGGFVRMTGDDPRIVYGKGVSAVTTDEADSTTAGGASPIEGSQSDLTPTQVAMVADESRWFLRQGYLPRCAIVIAGPLFNFLFGWVLATGLYFTLGVPEVVDGPVTIGSVSKGLPAEVAGLRSGDHVRTVDGKTINSYGELLDVVRGSNGRDLSFVIERPKIVAPVGDGVPTTDKPQAASNEQLTIVIKPTSDAKEFDVLEGRDTSEKTYRIGIDRASDKLVYHPVGIGEAALIGGKYVADLSFTTLRVLKALLTGILSPTKTIGGPLSIIQQTSRSTEAGLAAVLGIMIFLNVTLGVMNLLPIPVLDGGHLTLFTLEKIKGGPLSSRFQDVATQVGMGILLLLMVFAIGNDVVRMFLTT